MKKLNLIIIFFASILPFIAHGQGWEKHYETGASVGLSNADKTLDEGVLLSGVKLGSPSGILYPYIYKTDADGNLQSEFYDTLYAGAYDCNAISTLDGNLFVYTASSQGYFSLRKMTIGGNVIWENIFSDSSWLNESNIAITNDGGYLNVGKYSSSVSSGTRIIKLDADGNLEWEKEIEDVGETWKPVGTTITSTNDILLTGYHTLSPSPLSSIKKLDGNSGDIIWEKFYAEGSYEISKKTLELNNGDFVLAISTLVGSNDSLRRLNLLKIDPDGNQIWLKEFTGLEAQSLSNIEAAQDGGFVVAGSHINSLNNSGDFYLLKTDSAGNEMWRRSYGDIRVDRCKQVLPSSDGGFYLAGITRNSTFNTNIYLIKTDDLGHSFTNQFKGSIYHDENLNCSLETDEDGLRQRLIEIQKENKRYLTLSDSLGNFSFNLDTGMYQMKISSISPYWEFCNDSSTINFTTFHDTIVHQIGEQAIVDCPLLDVSIGTPFLRRCFENVYNVQYCNYGTIAAEDAYVVVTLDPSMDVNSTSLPIESVTGLDYTFNLGDVAVNECGSFSINVQLGDSTNCESIPLGLTHCVEAHIYPDSICLPVLNWSGASVEVDALCVVDSIEFTITNVGTAPTQSGLNYIVVEDNVVLLDGNFSLDPNESKTILVETNGSTFRLEAEQEPNHPGTSMPSISVENCGDFNAIFTSGFINIFPQDDGNPFVDIDCRRNIGAYDPNDKQGFPLGIKENNYISKGQDIEYLIRFQNTGTDTAFKVVIKDSLSNLLDITSVRPGASSHPYLYDISGNGVLNFTFDNIMLPDSNINEPASHGFVKFKVSQQPDLISGTRINNSAAIFFDFNAPIITNQTLHTIEEDIFSVSIDEQENPLAEVKVFPNPFTDFVNIEVEGISITNGAFKVYDVTGRLSQQQRINNNKFTFYKKSLGKGIYFFIIENEGQLISSGKIFAR